MLRIAVSTSDAGDKVNILRLGKVREFVKPYGIVLSALILINVVFGGAISEIDDRTVYEFSRVM